MRKLLSLVLIFPLMQSGQAQIETHSTTMPPNTEVEIELLENIFSEALRAGQCVAFKVVNPVVVDGTTIMPAGMPVSGEVKAVQSARAWRKAGNFDLLLKPIHLEDGAVVQLDFARPKLLRTKKEKTGNTVATSLALAYYFPLIPAALISWAKKGKAYNIRSGERYLVYVVSSTPEVAPQKTMEPAKP